VELPKPRLTARKADHARISSDLIKRAGQELATSLDYQATLKNVTNLIVPALAEDCFIYLKNEQDGEPQMVSSAHADPKRGEVILRLLPQLHPLSHPQMPIFAVMSSGVPRLIQDPDLKVMRAPRPDEELLRLFLTLRMRSRIIVPLKARGETIGAMTWIRANPNRAYTTDDLKTAEEIAQRAAYAIDNARLHEAQKLANQRLNDLLNGLRASVWEAVWEPHGNPVDEVTFVNQAAESLLGYPAEQLRDRSAARVMIPDPYFDHVMREYSSGIRAGRDFEVEYQARRGDGQMVWMRDVVRVSRDPDGRPRVRAVTTDITKLKQVEERLQILAEAGRTLDSSLDYEATLANVTSLIVPALADDCIIFLESGDGKLDMVTSAHSDASRAEAAREFFRRYALLEHPGHPLQMVHRAGEPVLVPDAISAIDPGTALGRESYESSIGSQVNAGLAVPMRSRGQILGVMVWVCVESGRHYGREDLRLAEEVANRAAIAVDNARLYKAAQDGVASRDRFLAMLGHELRNPLNSISIVARMLERESLSDERLVKMRTLIGRETRQLSSLVDDILDVSRILAGKMTLALQSVDLTALVREGTQSFEDQARQRELTLAAELPEESITMVADPVRMRQVVANLISNAVKFSAPAGRIEVRLSTEDEFALLIVRDRGIGIAPELLERIFEPFAQAALTPPHGLGLGLAVVKQVTELHGGKVTAQSEGIGKGAEFTVRLPRTTMH
jgi:PAS domain S-box-containing protein